MDRTTAVRRRQIRTARTPARKRDVPRLIARLVLAALVMVLGAVAGIAALLGTAMLIVSPPLFVVIGLAAFCAVNFLGIDWALRGSVGRRASALAAAASTTLVVVAFAGTTLVPLSDPRLPPAPVAGQQFWDLPTGSRIAYVRLPAAGDAHPTPLIFVHGGPGTPDMAGDAIYFGQLTADGYDVYVYDEVGTGRSARLADPRGYTLTRDVADLEAIRRAIGADRLVLIGHSYGGVLAAAYAAAHGEHVAGLVLSSPGDPAPAVGGASTLGRLTPAERRGVYALILQPRALLAYGLLQVNPLAAHAFAGDAELDARFDRAYNQARAALHCRGLAPGPELHGLGFYANQYPQSATRPLRPDFLPALAGRAIPTLVIKGRCDYLSWSSATAYLRVLSGARLVYLDGAGHNAYQDEPEPYLAAVRAFLAGQAPPGQIPADSGPPADYEGPR